MKILIFTLLLVLPALVQAETFTVESSPTQNAAITSIVARINVDRTESGLPILTNAEYIDLVMQSAFKSYERQERSREHEANMKKWQKLPKAMRDQIQSLMDTP